MEQVPEQDVTAVRKALVAENEANMQTCQGIIKGLTAERDALAEKVKRMEAPSALLAGTPRAWERKWSADGETPAKVKTDTGRWVWPLKFKLLPVTNEQCLKDDVPLFPAPGTNSDAKDAARYRAEGERAWSGAPEFRVDYMVHPCTKEDFLTARDAAVDLAMAKECKDGTST